MTTTWSNPKTNFFAGILDLRKALASGNNAKLIREYNEKCEYPIRVKNRHNDFRQFKFNYGTLATRTSILNDTNLDDFQKDLSLNYKACYGTREAMDKYYLTGIVSADNFKGVGRSHLVKITDMVDFLETVGDDRAEIFREQYITMEQSENRHFYDFFTLERGNDYYSTKKFKRKLWVVDLSNSKEKPKTPAIIKILNVLLYPIKFIPTRRVLRMDEYTNYTFSIGGITSGYSVEFQIPKKFSF